MLWGPAGQRLGRLVVPAAIQGRLSALDYPSIGEDMGIEAALSYAVFVGMRLGLSLVLSGDASVWDASWGRLHPIDSAPPSDHRASATLN